MFTRIRTRLGSMGAAFVLVAGSLTVPSAAVLAEALTVTISADGAATHARDREATLLPRPGELPTGQSSNTISSSP